MRAVNVFETKSTLSKLLERIETGKDQDIVIARNGRPVARPTRLASARVGKRIGVAKGRFTVPDSIDEDNAVVAKLFLSGGTSVPTHKT